MSIQKPTIILAPGAWHLPEHYAPTAELLRNAGYEVFLCKYASVGIVSDPGNMLHEDALVILNALQQTMNSGKDAILVMHSYGGASGSEVAAVACEKQRSNPRPSTGRLRRLLYLAAHVIEKGVSLVGSGRVIPNVETDQNGMMTHMMPYERYYTDVSREQAEPALAMLEPMASSAMNSPTSYAGWKDYGIPCTFIRCLQDIAVPQNLCEMYISRMKDADVELSVETIDAGHCANFTAPKFLAEAIQKIAA